MDRDALQRAQARIAEARAERPNRADLEDALERAETALDQLARTAAELETTVPERLGSAIEEGMKAEVLPVARQIAEVRGLTGQVVGDSRACRRRSPRSAASGWRTWRSSSS